MLLFLLFLVPCAAAQNIQTMLVGRFLNGLVGSAFLTVAAGTVADLFASSEIEEPMMLYTAAPFIGPVLGPVIGGFINSFASWRWSFYVLLIWSDVLQIALIFVPETHHPTILHRKAMVLRKESGNSAYKSASEISNSQTSLSTALIHSLYRPFQLLALDLMCLFLCLYSAVILGIFYLFFGVFPLVFHTNHDFDLWQAGLTFPPSRLACSSGHAKEAGMEPPAKGEPEFRLPPAIMGAVFVTAGIFWFGWATYRGVHWIVPLIALGFFGFWIFLFSIIWTFLVDAYPKYAASALEANTFARCMFAAAFPLLSKQMYKKLGYQWATSLLAFITLAMLPLPYAFFVYGKSLRAKSKFAST
ncbi:bicyclomycin resistance protein [Amylocarpus encephaloides]|uniref:Bicyclomycin resistance protein n=1 Tax=Amylocarpus encephaloides TaxID=45428 RepID=A0A9P7YHP5_9HELO|nr:bicyclomycin resistance protein [Amylocarpus encephaloides]